jgi:hypothetical protein
MVRERKIEEQIFGKKSWRNFVEKDKLIDKLPANWLGNQD